MMEYVWVAEIRYSCDESYKWTFLFVAENLEDAKADVLETNRHSEIKFSRFWTDKSGYTYTRRRFTDWGAYGETVYETIRFHSARLVKTQMAKAS